jgi:hypothetical protein
MSVKRDRMPAFAGTNGHESWRPLTVRPRGLVAAKPKWLRFGEAGSEDPEPKTRAAI